MTNTKTQCRCQWIHNMDSGKNTRIKKNCPIHGAALESSGSPSPANQEAAALDIIGIIAEVMYKSHNVTTYDTDPHGYTKAAGEIYKAIRESLPLSPKINYDKLKELISETPSGWHEDAKRRREERREGGKNQ